MFNIVGFKNYSTSQPSIQMACVNEFTYRQYMIMQYILCALTWIDLQRKAKLNE